MTEIRTRFAPSPTGYMHIGNLRTALYAYLVAKKDPDGVFILRIEDTDQGRLVEGATDIIYETLKQCHLDHDEGPDVGGPVGPYVQSDRMKSGIYMEYAKKLIALGGAHYCFCDEDKINAQRELQEARGESFKYDDPCKLYTKEQIEEKLASGCSYVIRQNIPLTGTTSFEDEVFGHITVENATLDESILIKSDGFPTYNFANVIDDHMMGITDVVRGMEYLSSTPKYNLIYQAFNWNIPRYIHCPPVMKDAQNKLSKRNGDASYQDLIAKGYLTPAVLNYIALCGWSPKGENELFTLAEMEQVWSEEGISKSPAIFDPEKLRFMNGEYIRRLTPEEFYDKALPWIDQAVHTACDKRLLAHVLQQRCEVLSDIPAQLPFLDAVQPHGLNLYVSKKMKTTPESAKEALTALIPVLDAIPESDWNAEHIHTVCFDLIAKKEVKNGWMLWPMRIALTGMQFTPGGGIEIAAILGKAEAMARLRAGLAELG